MTEEISALEQFYSHDSPEELRLQESSVQYIEFLTATKYLDRHLSPACTVLDNCAGTGVYAFYLASRGHRVTAGDFVAHNVDILRDKQPSQPILAGVYQGDARCLPQFKAKAFDAVLCMGALYHLKTPEDRLLTVKESLRVLADNGLFACTYMNRYAVILGNAQGSLDNLEEILSFANHGEEGVFYASTPEEMNQLMMDVGLETVCHVALDGMSTFLKETTGLLDSTGLTRWREYHFSICEVPSLLGTSYHNLYIGRKRASSV